MRSGRRVGGLVDCPGSERRDKQQRKHSGRSMVEALHFETQQQAR